MAPIRALSDFVEQPLTSERFVQVQGARVIVADYDLLQHDFAELSNVSLEKIDGWLLDHAAFISERQATQTYVNSPIPVRPSETVIGYRPPRYGRAAILQTSGGLLDIKGIGVATGFTPDFWDHSNGLLSLKDALHDWYYEDLLRIALRDAGISCGVLPNYAVLDMGFTIKPIGQLACLLIRRAHTRPSIEWGNVAPGSDIARMYLNIELALRRYGVTSVNKTTRFQLTINKEKRELTWNSKPLNCRHGEIERITDALHFTEGELTIDGVNLQSTSAIYATPPYPILVDLGQFSTCSHFSNPLYSCASAKYWRFHGEIMGPNDPRFSQPIPARSFTTAEGEECDVIAQQYSDKTMGPKDVMCAMDTLVRRIELRFSHTLSLP